ncbi:hypothetical protein L083_6023 [Actinoplanes sp. N902-109]|nr:hypothetical protein L083_6023 [Actinoplanes sp. N902-109]
MHVPEVGDTRVGVRLREAEFDLITRILGCESDAARARLLDINPKTVTRVRRGVIGEEFIAKTLIMLRNNAEALAKVNIGTSFEDVFEVGEKQVAA